MSFVGHGGENLSLAAGLGNETQCLLLGLHNALFERGDRIAILTGSYPHQRRLNKPVVCGNNNASVTGIYPHRRRLQPFTGR
jgi:hypothetical protein